MNGEKKIDLKDCSDLLKMCVENCYSNESGMYFFEVRDFIQDIEDGKITREHWEQLEKEIKEFKLADENIIELHSDFDSIFNDKDNIDCVITCYQDLPNYFELEKEQLIEKNVNELFPDENFRKAILEDVFSQSPHDTNRNLCYEQLEVIQKTNRLLIANSKIKDLTGIEEFKNLKVLDVSYNPIKKLDLFNVDTLKKIYAYNCDLSKISVPNKDLTELNYLDVSDNHLTFLDLEGQTSLKYVYAGRNNLGDICLTECEELQFLACSNNSLTDIDVSDCYNLISFECDRNHLRKLDLENNEDLVLLSCDVNELVKLDVSHCKQLETLSCDHNWLTSLNIKGLDQLKELSCKNNDKAQQDLLNHVEKQPKKRMIKKVSKSAELER